VRAKHIGILVLLLVVTGIAALFWLAGHVHRPLELGEQERLIVIERGTSLHGLLRQLDREGVLGDAQESRRRRLGARLYDLATDVSRRIRVGEYVLRPGDTLVDVLVIADPALKCGTSHGSINPSLLRPSMTVVDVSNPPLVHPLLEEAIERGCRTVAPRAIYEHQVAAQYKVITGKELPGEALASVLAE